MSDARIGGIPVADRIVEQILTIGGALEHVAIVVEPNPVRAGAVRRTADLLNLRKDHLAGYHLDVPITINEVPGGDSYPGAVRDVNRFHEIIGCEDSGFGELRDLVI